MGAKLAQRKAEETARKVEEEAETFLKAYLYLISQFLQNPAIAPIIGGVLPGAHTATLYDILKGAFPGGGQSPIPGVSSFILDLATNPLVRRILGYETDKKK